VDQSERIRSRDPRTGSVIASAQRSRRRIEAVGFDFDHTLGIDNKLERVAFLRLLDEICERGGGCIGTLAEEIERIDTLLAQQRSGAFSIESAVEGFASQRGATDPRTRITEYKRTCLEMVPAFVIPEPSAREMLAELRRREVRVAILTNGWSPLQQEKARRVGFDGPVVVSSDVGVQKPEPGAFAALATALRTPPEAIAYVGDTPASDIAGALRAGMQAIWFDAEGVKYPPELPAPTVVIHRLAELIELL
jgi:HAD superfamily hydrolase (TIGR01549 family)